MNGADTELRVLNKIKDLLSSTADSVCIGKEELSVTGSVVSLTPATSATSALIQVESSVTGKAIRFWEDGSTPSTTSGMFRGDGDYFDIISSANLAQIKITQAQAGTTKLNIAYYK